MNTFIGKQSKYGQMGKSQRGEALVLSTKLKYLAIAMLEKNGWVKTEKQYLGNTCWRKE